MVLEQFGSWQCFPLDCAINLPSVVCRRRRAVSTCRCCRWWCCCWWWWTWREDLSAGALGSCAAIPVSIFKYSCSNRDSYIFFFKCEFLSSDYFRRRCLMRRGRRVWQGGHCGVGDRWGGVGNLPADNVRVRSMCSEINCLWQKRVLSHYQSLFSLFILYSLILFPFLLLFQSSSPPPFGPICVCDCVSVFLSVYVHMPRYLCAYTYLHEHMYI